MDIKEVVLLIRFNVKESHEELDSLDLTTAKMVYCFNEKPVGFGENHNKNFNKFCQPKDIFIVCNPDIEKNFKSNIQILKVNCKDNILVVPKILNSDFSEADFRRQDLKLTLFRRLFDKKAGTSLDNYSWVPSVFKCFTYSGFETVNGYDENIFMYYEDYDICMRAGSGGGILISENDYVVHAGTREAEKCEIVIFPYKKYIYVLRQKFSDYKYV